MGRNAAISSSSSASLTAVASTKRSAFFAASISAFVITRGGRFGSRFGARGTTRYCVRGAGRGVGRGTDTVGARAASGSCAGCSVFMRPSMRDWG